MMRINNYVKVRVFCIDNILEYLEEELKNSPALRMQIITVIEHINERLVYNASNGIDEVYHNRPITLTNTRISDETGLSKSQVKKVKAFLSKYEVINFYKVMKSDVPPVYINLWLLNTWEFGKMVDVSFEGEILGDSDIYNRERPWMDPRVYHSVKEGVDFMHLSTFVEEFENV